MSRPGNELADIVIQMTSYDGRVAHLYVKGNDSGKEADFVFEGIDPNTVCIICETIAGIIRDKLQ